MRHKLLATTCQMRDARVPVTRLGRFIQAFCDSNQEGT